MSRAATPARKADALIEALAKLDRSEVLDDLALGRKAGADAGDSDVERRVAAASRTYYAALHRCHPIARAQGIFADVPGTHAQVIEALTGSRDRQLKSISWRLEQCPEKRVKADYHLADDFALADAQLMASQCERIWVSAEGVDGVQRTPE